MTDEELLLSAPDLKTVYFDGFGAFRKINGVLRCIGYIIDNGAQMNLVVSLAGARSANDEAKRVLEEKPTVGSAILERLRLAH